MGKESTYIAGDTGDVSLIPGLGSSSGVGNGNTPVFLPGESYGQRILVGYSPWGGKELDTTQATEHVHACARSHTR